MKASIHFSIPYSLFLLTGFSTDKYIFLDLPPRFRTFHRIPVARRLPGWSARRSSSLTLFWQWDRRHWMRNWNSVPFADAAVSDSCLRRFLRRLFPQLLLLVMIRLEMWLNTRVPGKHQPISYIFQSYNLNTLIVQEIKLTEIFQLASHLSSTSCTKKASPDGPSFICSSICSPFISMYTW